MGRTWTRMTLSLGAALSVLAIGAFAQDFTQKPKAPSPDGLPGQQLIVWTETQKPHPLPASSPEMYQASSQTQMLTGTILAQGPDLLFATADHASYRINNDNPEQLKAFAGRQVQVSGNVDQATQSVYLLSIEQQ